MSFEQFPNQEENVPNDENHMRKGDIENARMWGREDIPEAEQADPDESPVTGKEIAEAIINTVDALTPRVPDMETSSTGANEGDEFTTSPEVSPGENPLKVDISEQGTTRSASPKKTRSE